MKIILASQSPRRRELLENIGISDFVICPAKGEESVPAGLSPEKTVEHLALQKAREVAMQWEKEDLIIAADTLVYIDGESLGKPADENEAIKMLSALSGRTHTVYTGVALIKDGKEITESEASKVTFAKMTPEEIRAYVDTKEPMDKAGAYGIQGYGSVFVEKINGDYFNVMGLPLHRLYSMLKTLDINIFG